MSVSAGMIVADKYEVLGRIGEGGMGEVFHARHKAMDRDVALKLLKEVGTTDSESFKRFLREAKILGGLRHKNLVSCFEFGEWEGTAFIAMEYVDGHSLMTELAPGKRLGAERVLKIGQQIAAALECAHAAGVTHRDLKPHNIVLCQVDGGAYDLVKLIDFGLARLIPQDGKTVTKLTQTGVTVGSVAYMAPEQCLGMPVDARADIYAFGTAMHHALRGAAPFDSQNPVLVMQMHLEEDPPRIGRDDLPVGFETVLRKCMAKDVRERYQTATELAEALDMVARGEGQYLPEFVPEVTTVKPVLVEPPLHRPAKKSMAKAMIAIAIIGSLAAFALAKALQSSQQPQPERLSTKDLAIGNTLIERMYLSHMQHLVQNKPVDAAAADKAVRQYIAQNHHGEEAIIALSLLAKLYGDAGQLDKAVDVASEAREIERDVADVSLPDAYWATAQISLRRNELGFASRAVKEAVRRVEPQGATHIPFRRERTEGTELLTIADQQFGRKSPAYAFANTAQAELKEHLQEAHTSPYSGPAY